jgi:hypothetical protein
MSVTSMKSALPAAALVLGIVLLGASALWAIFFPATRGWTEEKSARMTELGNRAADINLKLTRAEAKPSMHSGLNAAELKAEYEKVSAEYKTLYEEFNGATESPKTASRILRWSGIAFVVAGAIVVFANREG